MTLTLLNNGELGSVSRAKINAGLTMRNNVSMLNIRDYGATGNGTTDDSAAIAAAIAASNAIQWTGAVPPLIYAPAGAYKIMGTQIPTFGTAPGYALGGGVVGDGSDKTMFVVDKTYSGDVFSWAEAWWGTYLNDPNHWTGSVTDNTAGPIAQDFAIYGDQTGTNTQVALGLYDRCDNAFMANVHVHYMKRGLYIGAPKVQVESYNRESHYQNLKFFECGTSTLPAVELTSTGSGDTTNQLCFYDLNISGPKSVGLWLRGNPASAVRLIRFFGLRIEGYGGRTGDLMIVGDTAMTGNCRDIYAYGVIMIGGQSGYACLRLTANTLAHQSYLIGLHGGQISGTGVGIAVDYGRALAFELNNIETTGTSITLGANASPNIYLNGYGSEEFWTKTVAGAANQAGLRIPTNYANETATTAVDPVSLADGAGTTINVPAAGALAKDFALVSFDNDLQGITLTAWCTPDIIKCRFQNETGGVIDLASGTLRAKVIKSAT